MIFLVLSGKIKFCFPENMILFFRRKMKDGLSQKKKKEKKKEIKIKISQKYDIFYKRSQKLVFSKKLQWNMIFLVLSGNMIFFPQKHDIFSLC